MNKYSKILALCALTASSTLAYGDILAIRDVRVNRVLVTSDTTMGGCMAQLTVPVGAGCTGYWVAFSCTADFADKDRAYRMFDMAQMAYTLNKRVTVFVDNTKLHNGYCVANRIDVYN